ncbi:MAG: caspase family protein [Saprospiraceae bacterium]|nr:caspase family protein [Saprospiraceae bacterium]
MREVFLVLALFCLNFSAAAQKFTCIKGNCKTGHGACVFPSGARYEGDFENGNITGLGVLYYPNGDTYIGNWRNQVRQGKGRFRFASGNEYLGEFDRNLMQGYGVMTYANGNRYEGQWKANLPFGKGTYTLATGGKYVGYFVNGRFEGQGTMYYGDGSYYQGEWKNNERHGEGALVMTSGLRKTGWWQEDELVESSPVLTREERELANAKDDLFTKSNQLPNCNFQYCASGMGEYTYPNGVHYIGTFEQGRPHGQATVRYPNGDRYQGSWKAQGPNGEGIMYYANGRVLQAQWSLGRPTEIVLSDKKSNAVNTKQPAENQPDDDVKVWAVLVGASQYKHMQSLRFTDDDAYQLFAFLKSPYGGAVPDEQISLLVDEDATRQNIMDAMRSTFGQADENDIVFFYFSGHGEQGAFLPVDYDGYNNQLWHQDVRDIINEVPAKHKFVVADACHSGSIFLRRTPAHQILEKYYRVFANSDGGLALLMSSKGEEYSMEDNGLRAGVFSHYLIKAMRGAADQDYNGVVTVQETYAYVRRNVQLYTGYVQTPILLGVFEDHMPISVVH